MKLAEEVHQILRLLPIRHGKLHVVSDGIHEEQLRHGISAYTSSNMLWFVLVASWSSVSNGSLSVSTGPAAGSSSCT